MTGNQMTLNYGNFILLVNVLVLLSPLLSITLRLNGHLELDKHSLNIASKGGNGNNEYIPVDTLEQQENVHEVGVTNIDDIDEEFKRSGIKLLDFLGPIDEEEVDIASSSSMPPAMKMPFLNTNNDNEDNSFNSSTDKYTIDDDADSIDNLLQPYYDQQELEPDGSSGAGVVIDNNQNDNLETVGDDHQRFPSALPVGNKDVTNAEEDGTNAVGNKSFSSAGYEFLMAFINNKCPSSSTSPAAAAVSTNVNGLVKPPIIIAVNKEIAAIEINPHQLWGQLKEISPELTVSEVSERGLRGLLSFLFKSETGAKESMEKYGPSLKLWLKKSLETEDIRKSFTFDDDCQKLLSKEVLKEKTRRTFPSDETMLNEIKDRYAFNRGKELKEFSVHTFRRFLGLQKSNNNKLKTPKKFALAISDWLVDSRTKVSGGLAKSRKRKASDSTTTSSTTERIY